MLRRLDPRQRKALALFRDNDTITSRDVEKLFGIYQRTARSLLSGWTESRFLSVADPAKKGRKYGLGSEFRVLGPRIGLASPASRRSHAD
ncbi:MAG: hypothetical protein FJ403_24260 [Verrucomicrobia bacterium]|nr:hypothetical protein [Verrucomicrobiota bacterium]